MRKIMAYQPLQIATTIAMVLAFFVVMLGAYTRLTDAGLGCPDWPGCYGHMVLPTAKSELSIAQTKYPQMLIESKKAWTEMTHRYVAGCLALLILFIGLSVLKKYYRERAVSWKIPVALLILVVFQAALGMWTVTLKLLPAVVMAHLLGGICIFAGLCRFRLQLSPIQGQDFPSWRFFIRLACFIIFLQIALGGWVSSNYAGISCIGFPQCNGMWFPELHFSKGFHLLSPIGTNYQGGVLDTEVRASIQWIHRLGAVVTASYLLILSAFILLKSNSIMLKRAACFMTIIVLFQFVLGIMNVLYLLPLPVALAHNGFAALLLAIVFSMLHFTSKVPNIGTGPKLHDFKGENDVK